jgi:hypothetical protein
VPWLTRSTSFPWECQQGVAIPRTGHSSPLLGPVHETAIFRPGKGSGYAATIPRARERLATWTIIPKVPCTI